MYTNYAIISLSNYERVFNRKIVIGFLYATAQTFFFFTINTQKCCVQSLVSCYSTDWFRKTLYGCLQLFNKLFSLEFHIQLFSIFYQTMVFTTKLYYVLQYISFSLFIGKISKKQTFRLNDYNCFSISWWWRQENYILIKTSTEWFENDLLFIRYFQFKQTKNAIFNVRNMRDINSMKHLQQLSFSFENRLFRSMGKSKLTTLYTVPEI